MTDAWLNYLSGVTTVEPPFLDNLPVVPLPDSFFMCLVCREVSDQIVCRNCEDPNGGDGVDD